MWAQAPGQSEGLPGTEHPPVHGSQAALGGAGSLGQGGVGRAVAGGGVEPLFPPCRVKAGATLSPAEDLRPLGSETPEPPGSIPVQWVLGRARPLVATRGTLALGGKVQETSGHRARPWGSDPPLSRLGPPANLRQGPWARALPPASPPQPGLCLRPPQCPQPGLCAGCRLLWPGEVQAGAGVLAAL